MLDLLLNADIFRESADESKIDDHQKKQNATAGSKNKDSPPINKKKRYKNIQSKYRKESLLIDPNYKGGAEKFFINANLENPEFEADLQTAQKKLFHKSMNVNESKNEKEKILNKLLFQEIIDKQSKNGEEKLLTNNEIKNKVADFLSKKQKKLEEIQQMEDEEIIKFCTFKPEIISEKLFPEKRDINSFLEDQKNHLKKVHDKIEKVKILLDFFSDF